MGGWGGFYAPVASLHWRGSRSFIGTLHEFGGPRHDNDDMCMRVALMDMAYLIGTFKLIESGKEGDVYDFMPKPNWIDISGVDDPRFTEYSVDTVMIRSHVMMATEGMKTWRGRKYLDIYRKWRA